MRLEELKFHTSDLHHILIHLRLSFFLTFVLLLKTEKFHLLKVVPGPEGQKEMESSGGVGRFPQ